MALQPFPDAEEAVVAHADDVVRGVGQADHGAVVGLNGVDAGPGQEVPGYHDAILRPRTGYRRVLLVDENRRDRPQMSMQSVHGVVIVQPEHSQRVVLEKSNLVTLCAFVYKRVRRTTRKRPTALPDNLPSKTL